MIATEQLYRSILADISVLPPDYLKQVNEYVKQLSKKAAAEQREAELLKKVDLNLAGNDAKRYEELRQLLHAETLTNAQQAELMALEKKREQLNIERINALVELAKIRETDIDTLMESLNLMPTEHE